MELYSITHTVISNGLVGTAQYRTDTSSQSTGGHKSQSGAEDTVTLSREGKDQASRSGSPFVTQNSSANQDTENLDQQELKQLQQLKRRDTEVRTHEQAHLSAAGRYARGGASFTYQKGPDGGSYAIGGEVGIDVAKESTPEATITKMQAIKRAALAPADPSGADKRIAAQANAKEVQARHELLQSQQEVLLRGESTTYSLSENQVFNRDNEPEIIASTHDSLKTKLAAYVKMAAAV
jgi:hypothetical protein